MNLFSGPHTFEGEEKPLQRKDYEQRIFYTLRSKEH